MSSLEQQEQNNWRTADFRLIMVQKIEEAIQRSGMHTVQNSFEMENHIFLQAQNKEQYLGIVARLIIHVKEMSTGNQGVGGGSGGNMMGLGPSQGPSQGVTATNLLQTLNTRPELQKLPPVLGQMQQTIGGPMSGQVQMQGGMVPMSSGIQGQMGGPMQSQLAGPMQCQMGGPIQSQKGGPMQNQIVGPMQNQMVSSMQNQMGGIIQSPMRRPIQSQMGGPMQNQMGPMQTQMRIQNQMSLNNCNTLKRPNVFERLLWRTLFVILFFILFFVFFGGKYFMIPSARFLLFRKLW